MASNKSNWIDALIGKRIRDRREERGLSQESLGRPLGSSAQQIQKYESGANRLAASTLFRLARELGVPASYFYESVEHVVPLGSGFSEDAEPYDLRSPLDGKLGVIVRSLLKQDEIELDLVLAFLGARRKSSK